MSDKQFYTITVMQLFILKHLTGSIWQACGILFLTMILSGLFGGDK